MGLSDSRHSAKKQNTGNMHLFFFDVYKNTVNIINPSSAPEVLRKRTDSRNNNNNNNNSVGGGNTRQVRYDVENRVEEDVNMNPKENSLAKSLDSNSNPTDVDSSFNRSDNWWDSNHNAVLTSPDDTPSEEGMSLSSWSPVDDEVASSSPVWEVCGSMGSAIERVDSGDTCRNTIEPEEGDQKRDTFDVLPRYKSFPTRPFRNKNKCIPSPTPDWPSFPMPSWHRRVQDELPTDNHQYQTPFWCSCSNPYCNYTCHTRCRALVSLDCKTQDTEEGEEASASPLMEEIHCEESDQSLFASSPAAQQDLYQKIEAYNATTATGSEMTLSEDGCSVSGFIRVHMNLCRPINVVSGTKPMSLFDAIREDDSTEKTLTSFYLPRDTIKSLHITSETTTQEVISALLRKYKVVDNPHKFALYERYYENGESMRVRMRRIQEGERPLMLALMCGDAKTANQQFVLQENDTGDISWEAFSLPELNNFLKILEREEDEYLNQVRLKYKILEEKLREAMEYVETAGETGWPSEDHEEDSIPESERMYQQSFPGPCSSVSDENRSATIAVSELNQLHRPSKNSDERESTMRQDMYRHLSNSHTLLDVS